MENQKPSASVSIGAIAIVVGFSLVAILGPSKQNAAHGNYLSPPVIQPPKVDVKPPFNNPISNPLDITKVIPGQEGVTNPAIAALGNQIGGPATLGISQVSKFPGVENLKGNSDYILVQNESGAVTHRESPYLVSLSEGTVLAAVRRPSSMGMIHTPVAEVAFSANSDAFISFSNGTTRVRNIDGMGQTLKVRVTSGPIAGKTYAVAPGYELVVSDHKLGREDLRPTDGILRRKSQTFDNGFAGVSQYHVQSALAQSSVVSSLKSKQDDQMSKRVLGDMSRMAAVLNHVQGGAGYSQQ